MIHSYNLSSTAIGGSSKSNMHHVQQSITYAWQTPTQLDLVERKNIQSNHELDEFIRKQEQPLVAVRLQ